MYSLLVSVWSGSDRNSVCFQNKQCDTRVSMCHARVKQCDTRVSNSAIRACQCATPGRTRAVTPTRGEIFSKPCWINRNWIVFTILRIIWNWKEIHLVPNQLENSRSPFFLSISNKFTGIWCIPICSSF